MIEIAGGAGGHRGALAALLALVVAVPAHAAPPGAPPTHRAHAAPSRTRDDQEQERAGTRGDADSAAAAPADDEDTAAIRERDAYFHLQRATGGGIPRGARERELHQAEQLPPAQPNGGAAADAAQPTSPFSALRPAAFTWTALGPRPISGGTASGGAAPYSGRVAALAPDPSNASTLYAAAASGGVWKTTDAGVSWTPVFDDQASLAVGAIAVGSGAVLAGTGEANFSSDSYYGAGIYRSTDGGTSWGKVTTDKDIDGCTTARIVFKPTDASIAYAAVVNPGTFSGPGSGSGCANPGLYRSTDGGASFTQLATGSWTDVAVDPSNADTWYAGLEGTGIFTFSDSSPATRTQLTSGLPTSIDRVSIAVAPSNHNRLYAAFTNTSGLFDGTNGGVWTSSNGGTSWSQISSHGWYSSAAQFPWYALALQVNRSDDSILYVGTGPNLVQVSGYGSGSSTPQSTNMHADFHALAYDASGRLWIGTDGGVYRTDDGFSTVTNLNANLALTQFEPGGTVASDGLVTGGTQDNGNLYYAGTSSWPQFGPGCDGGWGAVDPANSSDIVMTTQSGCSGSVFRTTNGGASYATASSGLNSSEAGLFYAPLVEAPNSAQRLYFGRTFLWTSANRGASWTQYSTHTFGTSEKVTAIGASASTSTVYVGTVRDEIAVTTNGGSTWTTGTGLPARYVTAITVDPSNASTAYATVSGFGVDHVYKTSDAGATWSDISSSLGVDAPANGIAVDWRTSPHAVYVATDVGTFVSNDDGSSWQDATSNMPRAVAMNVLLDTTHDKLIVMTHGRGVFSAPLTVQPAATGKVAFVSDRSGNDEIYSANADGSGVTQLTSNGADDRSPAWSPDGAKIYFSSNRAAGHYDLWVMNADGSNPTQLTNDSATDDEPAVSPGGGTLVFESDHGSGYDLYEMRTSGGAETRLTTDAQPDYEPAWKPDGTRIVYRRASPDEIWSMALDGSDQRQLTSNAVADETPTYNPAGTSIAFADDKNIATMNADGSGLSTLTHDASHDDTQPRYAPNGAHVVFTSDRATTAGGTTDVYVMTPDGANIDDITPGTTSSNEFDASFQPSGGGTGAADLRVTQAAPASAQVGTPATWTVTVTNAGPDPATSVALSDTPPAALALGNVALDQGSWACNAPPASTFTCTLASLAPDATATLRITGTPTQAGTGANGASVSSAASELAAADNSSSASTTATAATTTTTTTDSGGSSGSPPTTTTPTGPTESGPGPSTRELTCRLTAPKRLSARTLAKGAAVLVDCGTAVTVRLVLKDHGRTIATGRATLDGGGRVRLRGAKRVLHRARRGKVTLVATCTAPGAAPATLRLTARFTR